MFRARSFWLAVLLVSVLGAGITATLVVERSYAQAGAFCAPGQTPGFAFGFADLKSQVGAPVGDPVDCEHQDNDGNSLQTTSTGTLFWQKSTNIARFTSGDKHWAITSRGLVAWTGSADAMEPVPGLEPPKATGVAETNAQKMIEEGRNTFRFDTFGDEAFWGDALMLHQAIEGEKLGGVGPGVSPVTALSVGLKVDAEALPQALVQQIQAGQVDLNDPATTVALLKLNAVVGVKGKANAQGGLDTIGITCALCHSTVDDSFMPGVGKRLDGWANRDLNVGAIVALAPSLKPMTDLLGVDDATVRTVLNSWGPGKFDAQLILDGKAFRPDGKSAATLLPAAFGLAGVNLHTYTGWGSVTYWNAFVANLEMHGKGNFFDPRLNDASKFPVAAKAGLGNVRNEDDMISDKLPALHCYQLSIPAPKPPAGSFNKEAAERGDKLFEGKARCAQCHVEPTYSEPGWNMHTPAEVGIDDFQSSRSPDGMYRTTPLKGLWTHMKGGFFHDGRFATLADVVKHYNGFMNLNLNDQEIADIVEYLKSL